MIAGSIRDDAAMAVCDLRLSQHERARLDTHFVTVLRALEKNPPRLSPVQRRERVRHLARLDAYRRRGLFPRNQRFAGRHVPHFIDDVGTRCAMGHLIELSGERELVQRIAGERNYARVRELADVPELEAWLEANGLTADEAGRIQPSYCGAPSQNCLCATGVGVGYVEGTVGDAGASLVVTAVYGPVKNVAPGDSLELHDVDGVGTDYERLFAQVGGDAKSASVVFGAAGGSVTIPTTGCLFPQVASIPGPLPLAVVRQALSSGNEEGCEKTVTDHDPAWGVIQGDAECQAGGAQGTGGSGASNGSTGGTAAVAHDGGPRAQADAGCSVGTHGSNGSASIGLAVSAIWLVRRALRARRN